MSSVLVGKRPSLCGECITAAHRIRSPGGDGEHQPAWSTCVVMYNLGRHDAVEQFNLTHRLASIGIHIVRWEVTARDLYAQAVTNAELPACGAKRNGVIVAFSWRQLVRVFESCMEACPEDALTDVDRFACFINVGEPDDPVGVNSRSSGVQNKPNVSRDFHGFLERLSCVQEHVVTDLDGLLARDTHRGDRGVTA